MFICTLSMHWLRAAAFAVTVGMVLALSPVCLSAQPDNLQFLQQCARQAGDSLIAGYGAGDTICLSVAAHPATWLLEEAALNAALEHGIYVRHCPERPDNGISIAVRSLGIAYLPLDEPDSVQRIAHLEVSAAMDASPESPTGARRRLTRSISVRRTDTVSADGTSVLEASGYEFARGTLPPRQPSGFWSKIIEPAVILGASAVMVILLFTVRSQ
jgi:hypothetical protein